MYFIYYLAIQLIGVIFEFELLMGKKTRKEREKKRESFAATRGRQKQKNRLITIGIFAGVAVIVGISAYNFVTSQASVPGAPPGGGLLGDAHDHASMLVRIFGDKFDFATPAYQIKSSWIHFEGQDGNTIHIHSTGIAAGFLFDSLNLGLDEECFVFADGRNFCTNEDYTLKFYINHELVTDIREYVFKDLDRILISYGNENSEQIGEQLAEADTQSIFK